MIGGVDHIVKAPSGHKFGTAQLDMLFGGLRAKWPLSLVTSFQDAGRTAPAHAWQTHFSWEELGPEFSVCRTEDAQKIVDEQGVVDEVMNDILLVYVYPDEITFVTGTTGEACVWGEELCDAMLQHVTAFSHGGDLPWNRGEDDAGESS